MSKVPQSVSRLIQETLTDSEQGPEVIEQARQVLREKCKADLWFLCYHVLDYKDIDNKFHRKLCNTWVKWQKHPYSLWQLARSHLKTTLLTIGDTVREALNDANLRQIIFTATADLGTAILGEIQQHFEENEVLRWLFPEYKPDALIKNRGRVRGKDSGYWKTDRLSWPCRTKRTKDPSIMIGTLGSSKTGFHFDINRYDDVVTQESALTPSSCDATHSWFLNSKQLAHNPATHRRRLVGTPWSYADLQTREIRKEKALRKAEENYGRIPRNRLLVYRVPVWEKPGVPAWPERFTPETIADVENDLRDKPGVFACQYLLNPNPSSQAYFKEENINIIPSFYVPEEVANYAAIDLAEEEERGSVRKSDYTVISVAGIDNEGKLYLRDVYRDKLTPLDLIEVIFKLQMKWGIKKFAIETVAFQKTLMKHYKREAFARGIRVHFQPMKRQGTQKKKRILGLQPQVECGDFYITDDCPHLEEVIEEMVTYDKGANDDILDTLADIYAISMSPNPVIASAQPFSGTFDEVARILHGDLDSENIPWEGVDLLDPSVL